MDEDFIEESNEEITYDHDDLMDDDYSYSGESQEANQLSSDRLPLVPTDFTSVNEALQNFTAVFESRLVEFMMLRWY